MNNPFEYRPDAECEAAFKRLLERVETLKGSNRPEDVRFCRELDAGKMLGVLIASDQTGGHHTLYAFSGQIGDAGFHHPGFVGPAFDYLQPDGYFKRKEWEISRLNKEITLFEQEDYAKARDIYEREKAMVNTGIANYREKCRLSKAERDVKRKGGTPDEAELDAMIRESQFEKAELRRRKKQGEERLKPYLEALNTAQKRLDSMKERRRAASEALQQWLFTNFRLLDAMGETQSLSEIFADTAIGVPPSGAGECCGPKLLQAAYKMGLTPISMAEYWYGRPKDGEIRVHGAHYPACRGKCLPVLSRMLRGLTVTPPLDSEFYARRYPEPEIIFENDRFCIVNKPSGMLSVPGKGKAASLENWLIKRYGPEKQVKPAHRLDQDTSGLIVCTFGEESYRIMQMLFATRQVKKTYAAELEGDYVAKGLAKEGRISLPLSPDWLDRPRQRVDFGEGKEAITDYKFTGISDGRSRVLFRPLTGRTHQLRMHAASEQGLGMPIVGDRLYGIDASERLHLHAQKLEFTFPIDGHHYTFNSPPPF